MSAPPDITAILAALGMRPWSTAQHETDAHFLLASQNRPAQANPTQTPAQASPAQQQPPAGFPAGYAMPNSTPPAIPGFPLPQPTNTGTVDIGAIRPVSSGTVNLEDALAKARGFAADKGLSSYSSARPGIPDLLPSVPPPSTDASAAAPEDPRRAYRRSRSRSRSPARQHSMRDSYNPYRDERREDPRRGGLYGRDRSRSPRGRNTFSPPRRDRSPPPSDNEVILIDSSLVGLVIGRQGESLRRIEQESGTRIQFINGPESGPQRQCRITGSPGARIAAKREINRIIEENGGNPAREAGRNARSGSASRGVQQHAHHQQQQPALRAGEESSQIMVPDRTVGLIIGRGGETIRDLQERSGCHVNIVGENKSVNGLRPVNLIGNPEAAARAKELIMEIVESDTKLVDGPAQTGNRRDMDPYTSGPNKISESIYVPSDAVGMIIGKGKTPTITNRDANANFFVGGETIKDMQSTTGCKINVSQASGADIEREIGLVGTRQAIDDAKKAIWDKVDSVVRIPLNYLQ